MSISLNKAEHDELLTYLIQWWNAEFNGPWQGVYTEIEDGYKYLAGDQYTTAQRQWYESQRRPTNVYNLILPAYNRVLGDFLLGDLNQRVYPYAGGDPNVAQALQKYFDYLYKKSDGVKYELSKTVFAGHLKIGYIYPRYSDEKDFDGSIVISNIDEMEMLFDSRCKDDLLDDAKQQARSRWLSVDDIFYLWPQHKSKLQGMLIDRKESQFWANIDQFQSATMRNMNFVNEMNGQYRVIEFRYMAPEVVDVAVDTNTGEYNIFDLEGTRAEEYLKNPNIKLIKKNAMVKYCTVVIPGLFFLLEHGYCQLQDGTHDIVPFSAFNYGMTTIQNFGLFKAAKGPQDGFNDWRNQTAHIINKSANMGRIVKPNKIRNWEQIKGNNEPGQDVEIDENSNFADVYQQLDPPKYPFAHGEFSEQEERLFNIITGINANMMGRQENSQENATLFVNRVRENQKAFNVIQHNLSRVKQRVFGKAIKLLQREVTGQKVFMILDPSTGDPQELVFNQQVGGMIMNDLSVGEFQVFSDDVERNPTSRMLRNLQKNEIVQNVILLWKDDAKFIIPPKWWLSESELGDVNDLIENWEAWRNMVLQQGMQAQAMQQSAALVDAAQKKLQLNGEDQDYGDPAVLDSRMPLASARAAAQQPVPARR